MAEATLLTGTRGEGKTLIATMIARRYLNQGRIVATNVNFNLELMARPWNKTSIIRLPDVPDGADFNNLPVANSSYDESKNGLILLDEVSGFLNAQDWRAKETAKIRFWLSQSRKDGWDILFLCQRDKQLDSQIRDSIFEMRGIARNMSKIGIPFFSWFFIYFFGIKLRMPALHVFTTYYGFRNNAAKAGFEIIGGSDLYQCYDTKQKIDLTCREPGNPAVFGSAPATMLSAWHLRGRYMGVFAMYGKIAALMLFFGLVIGVPSGHFLWPSKPVAQVAALKPLSGVPPVEQGVTVQNVIRSGNGFTLILSDKTVLFGTDFIMNAQGEFYRSGSKWFKREGA